MGYGRQTRLDGRLLDATGDPLRGESVEVTETFDLGSTASERVREAITDGQGRFALVLPAGPSRRVEVEFAGSRSLDSVQSRKLDLGVRSDGTLAASERRPRVGESFRFFGRVKRRGVRLPAAGKLVELQVKRPEGWDTIRQAFRTASGGRWSFGFRFGDYYLDPTTFRFRLKIAREGECPYKKAVTRQRPLTVVPRD